MFERLALIWAKAKTGLVVVAAFVVATAIALAYGLRKGSKHATELAKAVAATERGKAAENARKTARDATDAMLDVDRKPKVKPDTEKRDDFDNTF